MKPSDHAFVLSVVIVAVMAICKSGTPLGEFTFWMLVGANIAALIKAYFLK